MSAYVATTVYCDHAKTHVLCVKAKDLRATWAAMDTKEREVLTGNLPAHCLEANCTSPHRGHFVGFRQVVGHEHFDPKCDDLQLADA